MKDMRKGFTLIELLVVISIIAILMTLGTAGFSYARRRAKESRAKADIELIKNALEEYRTKHGYYPEQTNDLGTINELVGFDELITSNGLDEVVLEDPWGNEYKYFRDAGRENRFVYDLWSYGIDGEDQTEDDIR